MKSQIAGDEGRRRSPHSTFLADGEALIKVGRKSFELWVPGGQKFCNASKKTLCVIIAI